MTQNTDLRADRSRPKKVTDDERVRIVELAEDGESRNAIARAVGRSAGVVSRIVADAGLSFDREATRAATEARNADAAERLAGMVTNWLDTLDLLFDRVRDTDDDGNGPAARDLRDLLVGAGVAQDKATALVDRAAGKSGGDAASLIGDLMAGLQAQREAESGGSADPEQDAAGFDS